MATKPNDDRNTHHVGLVVIGLRGKLRWKARAFTHVVGIFVPARWFTN